jgi:hypothetical protein
MLAGFGYAALHGVDNSRSDQFMPVWASVRLGGKNTDWGFEGPPLANWGWPDCSGFACGRPAASGVIQNRCGIAAWTGIAEAGNGLGSLTAKRVKPSTTSSAEQFRFDSSFRLI